VVQKLIDKVKGIFFQRGKPLFFSKRGRAVTWKAYFDAIMRAAERGESLFKRCPVNIEGGETRYKPDGFIDWGAASSAIGGGGSVLDVKQPSSGILDLSVLNAVPLDQREQCVLACLEFVYTVFDIKYIPGTLLAGGAGQHVDEGNIIAAYTLRNVAENTAEFDFKYNYGQDVTREVLELVKELCEGSYTALKSSSKFNPTEHDVETTPFQKSQTLDFLHTISAIVDSIEKRVELTTCEQDADFIPPSLRSPPPPINAAAAIPSVASWLGRIEKVIFRLQLLRDDADFSYLSLLAGKKWWPYGRLI
jgi:hypothetical protein